MKANVMKNFKKKNKKNKGFTLVELIIVIAIIAVLGIILAPQYIKYVDKSRWATDQNNAKTLLKEVQTAVVDVQESDGSVTDGTLVLTKTADPSCNFSNDVKTALTNADANWNKTRVTNKGKATGAMSTYTITISGNQVTGAWSGGTSTSTGTDTGTGH